jgi:hypothetical protein
LANAHCDYIYEEGKFKEKKKIIIIIIIKKGCQSRALLVSAAPEMIRGQRRGADEHSMVSGKC